MDSRALAIDGALDLRRTLRPLTLVWGRFADDGWWRAFRTPDGSAGLRVSREDGRVVVDAWGRGSAWVLNRVDRLVGLTDDPSSLRLPPGPVADLARTLRGVRFGSTGVVWDALMWAVLTQKVTGKEAKHGLRAITRSYSEPAPGPNPGVYLPPDPERIAGLRYHDLHDLGVERRRAEVLLAVARDHVRLDALAERDVPTARSELERHRGVGKWTSAETVVVSHGDPDVVSVGDFHLKHLVSWNLAGEERGTDERMLELLEPYRPHRGRVIRWLEASGAGYPRRGPKVAVRSFARY